MHNKKSATRACLNCRYFTPSRYRPTEKGYCWLDGCDELVSVRSNCPDCNPKEEANHANHKISD
jgi:hypothetical protein